MVAIPAPRTWTDGEDVIESYLDTDLRDGWRFFTNPPRVKVYNSTGQSIASGLGSASTADTLLTWDAEVYDTDGMHSTLSNNHRLTVVTPGAYEIVCHVNWSIDNQISDATHGPGNRYLVIRLNDSTASLSAASDGTRVCEDIAHILPSDGTGPQTSHCSFQMFLSAGDYLAACVGHSSVLTVSTVSGLVTQTFFAMRWIGTS